MQEVFNIFKDALDKASLLLENTITVEGFTLTDLDNLKTTIETNKTSINTASVNLELKKQAISQAKLNQIVALESSQTTLDQAKNSLNQAEHNLYQTKIELKNKLDLAEIQVKVQEENLISKQTALSLTTAFPRKVDLAILEAQVQEAQTALDSVQNNLNKSVLKAPINGVIAQINFEKAEKIDLTMPVISLIAHSNDLQNNEEINIEADISEVDIEKIKLQNKVDVILDAFAGQIFIGKVVFIEPAETIIDGVVYYKIKIEIITDQFNIKPGMTADVDIYTAEKKNVLTIPQRAIQTKNSKKFVQVLENGNVIRETEIIIGLRGDEGIVEVVSGLKDGDEIVIN
ncbi:efflux RND transporter periplasmic adaptor subunit [Patescibacteria group bacterium]|nr:efflux RND transporter periplasmic adaptor subunit [Patescibacteria group bacterium]MBU1778223.1 efflux RND transporter periplasmic adaptor subunit [Patescibacteria group bacterium]